MTSSLFLFQHSNNVYQRDNKIQLEAKRRQEADEQARITESHKREVEARDETKLQLIEALTEGEQLQAPILA